MGMKLEHRTLNERAYDAIREGLISGVFKPGQPLVIRTLAQNYGISITPVRDALQRLVAERLLEMLPNRSIAVPFLKADTFLELARIRTALEGLAGEMATPRLQMPHLLKLARLVANGEEAAGQHDGRSYARINQQFHFTIYEQCGSPVLLRMITDLWSQVGPFFRQLVEIDSYGGIANDEHRHIMAALENKDAALVRAHIVNDIATAAKSLEPLILAGETAMA
jgi:DNA-binding GntR family transcriptional regulator